MKKTECIALRLWSAVLLLYLLVCLLCSTAIADSTADFTSLPDELKAQEAAARQAAADEAEPECDGYPGCTHMMLDTQGKAIPLCSLGRYWVQNYNMDAIMLMNAISVTDFPLSSEQERFIGHAGSYKLTGSGKLTIEKNTVVSLTLDGATVTVLTLREGATANLSFANSSRVEQLTSNGGTLAVSSDMVQPIGTVTGSLRIVGDGIVRVNSLNASLLETCSGKLCVVYQSRFANDLGQGWQTVSVTDGSFTASVIGQYYGQDIPLCFKEHENTAFALLPAPESGQHYLAAISDGICQLTTSTAPREYQLTASGGELSISSSGILSSVSEANQSALLSGQCSLELHGAATTGTLAALSGAKAAFRLYGRNSFGMLTLQSGSTLSLKGTGVISFTGMEGDGTIEIDPQTNVCFDSPPSSTLFTTRIFISNGGGNPLAGKEVVLKLGNGEVFTTTTDKNGYITLWRSESLTGMDAVVLSAADTYATVLKNGGGTADERPTLTKTQSNAAGYVSLAADNAGTLGVQYYISSSKRTMPDSFQADAKIVYASDDGNANLSGIDQGGVITFRAFAARASDVSLNAATSDGFVFGEQKSFTVLPKYRPSPLSKDFDEEPFAFEDSDGLKIVWYKNGLQLDSAPSEPGTYTAKITVPAGHGKYRPGTQEATVEINRINYDPRPLSRFYDGSSYVFKESDGFTIAWYDESGQPLSAAPRKIGLYTAYIVVPEGNARYKPGTVRAEVEILPEHLVIMVYALGETKLRGELDPPFDFVTDPLRDGDVVMGKLTRMPGEAYGNYPYYCNKLYAVDENGTLVTGRYTFVMSPYSAYFFIDWNKHHYLPGDPLAVINPQYDEVHLSDGTTLRVQRSTVENLYINGDPFGSLVTDTQTNQPRPYTPSLRAQQGKDNVLLLLTTEAELADDGGFATDADGNRLLRGRRLTLGNWHLTRLQEAKISDMALSLNGFTLMFSLSELSSDLMTERMMAEGFPRLNSNYLFELEPVRNSIALAEGEDSARSALLDGSNLMRVKVYIQNGDRTLDISSWLPSARVLADAGTLMEAEAAAQTAQESDIIETVNGRVVEPAAAATRTPQEQEALDGVLGNTDADDEMMELGVQLLMAEIQREQYALRRFDDHTSTALNSRMVVPYTADEARSAKYTALMRTRPYLISSFTQNGLYGLTRP